MTPTPSTSRSYFSTVPHPTYPVVHQTVPLAGQTLIGYWIIRKPPGCWTAPRPSEMTVWGYLAVGMCFLFCWPLTCLPCFCSTFYEGHQIPVYGTPPSPPRLNPSAPPLVKAFPVDET